MPSLLFRISLYLLLLLLSFSIASQPEGPIKGRIVDTADLAIMDVQISVVDQNKSAFSSRNGDFLITGLPAGVYELRFSHLGFKTTTLSGIEVQSGNTRDVGLVRMQESMVELGGSVVTAARREKSLIDIPEAANLIPELAIRNRNSKTSAEALREETGIFVQNRNLKVVKWKLSLTFLITISDFR